VRSLSFSATAPELPKRSATIDGCHCKHFIASYVLFDRTPTAFLPNEPEFSNVQLPNGALLKVRPAAWQCDGCAPLPEPA
jgi:hypothetical protein